jgi:hypothetical protein
MAPTTAVEARRLARTGRVIQAGVWAVAVATMATSAITSFRLLRGHDWPVPSAMLPGTATDLALVVALAGDQALSRHDERAGWGTVLRWSAGAATFALNVSGALAAGDKGGAALHAIIPTLLILVTEAAGSYRAAFARIVVKTSTGDSIGDPTPAGGQDRSPSLAGTDLTRTGGPSPARSRPPSRTKTTAAPPPPDVSDLLADGRTVARALAAAGTPLTRERLIAGLRGRGVAVSTTRASALRRALQTEPHPIPDPPLPAPTPVDLDAVAAERDGVPA